MAVSQVDRLKNPCSVWTWNNLVATQPPPSAPAMPIRQAPGGYFPVSALTLHRKNKTSNNFLEFRC